MTICRYSKTDTVRRRWKNGVGQISKVVLMTGLYMYQQEVPCDKLCSVLKGDWILTALEISCSHKCIGLSSGESFWQDIPSYIPNPCRLGPFLHDEVSKHQRVSKLNVFLTGKSRWNNHQMRLEIHLWRSVRRYIIE